MSDDSRKQDDERKVAIVTGSCSAVGMAIAKELVLEGYCVVANGVEATLLNKNVEEIIKSTGAADDAKSPTPTIVPFAGDISDSKVSRSLVQQALAKFGRIDVLVNNSEILGSVNRIKENRVNTATQEPAGPSYFTLEEYEFEDESIHGAYVCTREVVSEWLRNLNNNSTAIKQQKNYSIINVSHCFSSMPKTAEESFIASKSGVDLFTASKERVKALTRTVALTVSGTGIRVNGIVPGIIAGETNNDDVPEGKTAEDGNNSIPISRPGRPEEVAQVVSFLASPKASNITGALINMDGGLSLLRPTRFLERDLEFY